MKVLVINAGSSSLKYQLIDMETESVLAKGLCERIGIDGHLKHTPLVGGKPVFNEDISLPTHSEAIAAVISSMSDNPLVIMCLINVFVLIVGLFMDVTPALTILTPIFLPIATDVGMDPVVFGVTMVYGLVIGLITPPVGNVLYVGIGISKITLLDLLKKIWPMVVAYIFILFLITLVPDLILFLPNLVMG